MAEIVWPGTRMFTSLSGDKEVARSHKRDARILIGYLLGTTSDLRPYAYRTVRLADGSIVQAHVWRGNGVARAKVRIWSPLQPGKDEESILYDLVLFLASNDAKYGFDDDLLPLLSANTTINPVWVWTKNNKLSRLDPKGHAWNLSVKKVEGISTIFSLGKSMFFVNDSLGNAGDVRINQEVITTANGQVFNFCVRKMRYDGQEINVYVIAETLTSDSTDSIRLEIVDFARLTFIGTATVTGLFNWGENQDTAYIKYASFSESGDQIAILVSATGPTSPSLYANFSNCAVFKANIAGLEADASFVAIKEAEAEYGTIISQQETSTRPVYDPVDGVWVTLEFVSYFEATGSYRSPFMFSWNGESLSIYTASIFRDFKQGYDVNVPEGTNLIWDHQYYYVPVSVPTESGDGCDGFYAGYAVPNRASTSVLQGTKDVINISLAVNGQNVVRHKFYEYVDLLSGGLGGSGGGGGAPAPDVLNSTAWDICIGLFEDSFSWLDGYYAVCCNNVYYEEHIEYSMYAPPCPITYCGYTIAYPENWTKTLMGKGITNEIRFSPHGCSEGGIAYFYGNAVTAEFYTRAQRIGELPVPGLDTEYVFDDAVWIKYKGKRIQVGEREGTRLGGNQRIFSEESFKSYLRSILGARFISSTAGLTMNVALAGKTKEGEPIMLISANNPETEVIRGDTVTLSGGGTVWHEEFGFPAKGKDAFPVNTQATFNQVAPDYYTGTIANLNTQE